MTATEHANSVQAAPRGWLARVDRNGERWLLLFFYASIISVISIDVVRRFGLSYSSVWGEEVARYAFIYLTWIAAAFAVRDRAHIRIDALVQALPARGKAIAWLLSDFFTLVFAVIALYLSIEPVITSIKFGSVTPGLRVSQAWFLVAVPFGFSCIVLRVLQSMRRDIKDLKAGRPPFEGHKLFD
ncbi:MAG: TRAP transporter small permease [Azoarcus sp. PHD]|nr:MAG: TRAP transporter small permease [Azoarcus sp. PHD]